MLARSWLCYDVCSSTLAEQPSRLMLELLSRYLSLL